jgi:phosphatidylserine/phosphatidylglycerophosphate/cardiolipin synthase-like enzyme
VDLHAGFNLLYTYGRQLLPCGRAYRPQHAIFHEIHQARRSIRLNLFTLGDLSGDHEDSVVDALIQARNRGVDTQLIVNGHMTRQGDPGIARTMGEELGRPLLSAIYRLKCAGLPVYMAYGQHDDHVPYCPIHAKSAIFDDYRVIEGSFNWYNTSSFSHDVSVVAARHDVAQNYLDEWHSTMRNLRMFL